MQRASQPKPRPAATLVPLRDHRGRLEVLLTKRPPQLRFMGGALVFPGGAVASADRDPRWQRASSLSATSASAALHEPDPEVALGFFVCALRESFEEVGLLLAEPARVRPSHAPPDAAAFLRGCLDLGLVLATDRLVPAGRWVTPLPSPIRFDTRFFLTRVPAGWEPAPDPREVDGCGWHPPAAALDELASGRAVMAPPTVEMLQRLTRADSVSEALERPQREPAGPLVTRLSPLVQSVLAPNPGPLTGPGTNTYVVGGVGARCVIDPATDDAGYLDALCSVAGEVAVIAVTHRHPDHVGGVAAMVARTEASVVAFGEDAAGGEPVTPLGDGALLRVAGATLRAHHTPGHARDHLCFFLEEKRALFAGDNVLGEGTPVISPPEGNMRAYLQSLRRLRELGARRIYPGHFRPLDDPAEVLAGYLRHRGEREAQVVAALGAGGRRLEEIVALAYADTSPELHPLAARSALAHLESLEEQGKVRRRGEVWEVATEIA